MAEPSYYPRKVRIPKLTIRGSLSGPITLKEEGLKRVCFGRHMERLCPHKLHMKLVNKDFGDKQWEAPDGCTRKWSFIERRFR